jgi:MYXO-CTERM domain-containing protein
MAFQTSFRSSCVALGTLAGSLLCAQPADACGGLFCSNNSVVNQAAERIIFAKNEDGTVSAVIEIMYEGPAHEFAWVLPVPAGEISVGVSSKLALDRLDQASNPQYNLNPSFAPGCPDLPRALPGSPVFAEDGSPPESVMVIAQGTAGPYDYTQLRVKAGQGEPEDVALMWLAENDYDVTALAPELLRGYLEDGQDLLAFKLSKGNPTGSVRPVLLTYESETPLIPIKPTAVAANEDMGVKVWVLGSSRAIPKNYMHLELNEGLINWFNPSSNYNDVVIAAANEAEGHGFVTEQAGPAGEFTEFVYSSFEAEQWENLKTGRFSSKQEFLQTAQSFFGAHDGFIDVLSNPELVPLRAGATGEQLVSCLSCYFETNVAVRNELYPPTDYPGDSDPINDMNVMDFLDEFYRLVIEPMEATKALFEAHGSVTRLYTTLSPDEMTVDPIFDYNPELPDVNNVHTANQVLQCDEDGGWEIELPQGMIVEGVDQTWPITIDDFPANLRIIRLSTSGPGEIVQDNAKLIAGLLTDLDIGEATEELEQPTVGVPPDPDRADPDDSDTGSINEPDDQNASGSDPDLDDMGSPKSSGGGGCTVNSPSTDSSPWALLAMLGLGLLRRRRSLR